LVSIKELYYDARPTKSQQIGDVSSWRKYPIVISLEQIISSETWQPMLIYLF